jgi:hypothetical protein
LVAGALLEEARGGKKWLIDMGLSKQGKKRQKEEHRIIIQIQGGPFGG